MTRLWPALGALSGVLGAVAVGVGVIGGLTGLLLALAMAALPVLLLFAPRQRRAASRGLSRLGLGLLIGGAAGLVLAAIAGLSVILGLAGAALYAGGLLLLQRPPHD